MRIYSMTATFGKLEHETLTLTPGLNIIEAPNEWGKSTWCAFLAAMLYGIATREHTTKTVLADKERYAPWSGSPMSGRIDLCWNGRDITIERRTKGRSVFGDFKAYETQTGLSVPELTAANCGEVLLGVEKSVFTRSAFVRLADMPVAQDDALRRRLNALVTTGDESGAADDLAQKLRDLKNRCRSNRANGLIPQALVQKEELNSKLRQLDELEAQAQQLRTRQTAVAVRLEELENHRAALEYAAAREYSQKAAAAKLQLETVSTQAAALQAQCDRLPSEQTLLQDLAQAQQLRQQREAVQLDIHLLGAPPAAPETPAPFRGMDPEQACRQAAEDTQRYDQLTAGVKKPSAVAWLCGLAAMLAGGVLLLVKLPIPGISVLLAGLALTVTGLVLQNNTRNQNTALQNQASLLLERYRPLQPEQWEAAAAANAQAQAQYGAQLSQHNAQRETLQQRLQQIMARQQTLTEAGGEQAWNDALARHRALAEALREQRRCADLVQTLSGTCKEASPPKKPDTLTFSEADTARLISEAEYERHQLQHRLGQCQGQMEALGSREALEAKLQQVTGRLTRLEETYAALELAQQTLLEASNSLQRRFAPQISRRAGELFSKLTGGRYDRLSLDEDLSLRAGARDEDTLRTALWRSDGTADQLYLALRLAVAGELIPDAPMVLDDALVRFDDTRLAAAMALLREEAQSRQVILFTCQDREKRSLDN